MNMVFNDLPKAARYQHDVGMKSPRPNLFLIGSMKSGTSYLSELLGAHPAVFMSSEKEPTYFVDPRSCARDGPGCGNRATGGAKNGT